MESNKGSVVTVVVILAVVILGVVIWWAKQSSTLVVTEGTATSTVSEVIAPASDSTARIEADLNSIDLGSTTQDLEAIDSDINSL